MFAIVATLSLVESIRPKSLFSLLWLCNVGQADQGNAKCLSPTTLQAYPAWKIKKTVASVLFKSNYTI